MKYKVIACKVFMRELYSLAWNHKNVIDIQWMRQQLHLEPEHLRRELQRAIDAAQEEAVKERYDAILLCYGLCSNGLVGLRTDSLPLVLPRAHDCMTLFLGSGRRYQKLFDAAGGGAYWYTPGWIEHCDMPSRERYGRLYEEYLEKFGEDNAEYLLEMEKAWMKEYQKAIYVQWPGYSVPEHREFVRESAQYFGWAYEEVPADLSILERMLAGQWDSETFLVVEPGQVVRASHRESIVEVS